jgi:3-dehydroquinate synthase
MIRGVIFDLGGTLIALLGDVEEGNARALLRWLRARGHPVEDGFVETLVATRRTLWAGRRDTEEVTADRAIRAVLERFGLPARAPGVDAARVIEAMALDKKVAGGAIRWVLLEDIGRAVLRSDVPPDLVREVVAQVLS